MDPKSGNSKQPASSAQQHERSNSEELDDELPTYQDSTRFPTNSYPESAGTSSTTALGPTISAPFNFPESNDVAPPGYSSSSAMQRPIAIPQQWSEPTAPFLPAYAPVLLNYGVPVGSWYSFLETMSAFLTAKVGKRAVSHAGDIAASVGRVPKKLGKSVANDVKAAFREIGHQAKRGSPLGVVGGVISGAVGLSVGTAVKTVDSILSLPGAAIEAGANPKTPRERAQAYAQAANKDWFLKRGLRAHLLHTEDLAALVNVSTKQFLDTANSQSSADDVMKVLRDLIESVELRHELASVPEPSPGPKLSPSGFPLEKQQTSEHEEPIVAGPSTASSSQVEPTNLDNSTKPFRISVGTLWLVLFKDDEDHQPAKN